MDPTRFRIQVAAKAAATPMVVLPAIAGAGAVLLGLVLGQPAGSLTFLGAVGLLIAGGMAATRLILRSEELARSVHEAAVEDAHEEHEDYLRRLARQLRRDRDDRTGEILRRLHHVHERFREDDVLSRAAESAVLLEIREKIEQLYWSCLRSLERSLVMWRAAREMSTPETRQAVLDRREKLVVEVQNGIAHLETTIDQLVAKSLQRDDETDMVRVRDELDVGLQVARRVEERMSELEDDLGTKAEQLGL
jgi:hypothetical protein